MNATLTAAWAAIRTAPSSPETLDLVLEAEAVLLALSEPELSHCAAAWDGPAEGGCWHWWRGLICEARGQWAAACEHFGHAIDKGCNTWWMGWLIARAARQLGQLELVDQACAAVLKVQPGFWFAREFPKHARGYYAQLDQDKTIEEFFQHHPPRSKIFVEVGAFDGVHYSNVRRLYERHGWTGLCIEPAEKNFRKLERAYQNTPIKCVRAAVAEHEGEVELHVSRYPHLPEWGSDVASLSTDQMARWQREYGAEWTVEKVPARRLTRLLDEAQIRQFDLLSVDAEGQDWEVLQSLDFARFQPQLIVVEYGRAREAILNWLVVKGYTPLQDNGQDLFLVRTAAAAAHPKIVGLVPARNEGPRLAFCLRALARYTDAIVYLDDCSEDSSVAIAESLAAECRVERIIRKSEWRRDEPGDRNALLTAGREVQGTHFVVIDADEVFTANLARDEFLRQMILALQPGDALALTWIQLWRSLDHYRFDDSVWTRNSKAVIFCDDRRCSYQSGFIHTPRVPAGLTGRVYSLPGYTHGLLHFQFVNWRNLLVKQAWYRCLEHLREPQKPVAAINELYAPSKDERGLGLKTCPPEWLAGYPFFEPELFTAPDTWREAQVKDWFKQFGRDHFRALDIWDLDWEAGELPKPADSAPAPATTSVAASVPCPTDLSPAPTTAPGAALTRQTSPARAVETAEAGEEYLVSAIVSTYNAERFMRGCLDDLEAQTIADRLEIIIIDSGSQQQEGAIVCEYQQRYPNLVYLRTEEREGIYAAWNRAIAIARGRYLTNANTDDRHHPAALAALAKALDEQPVGLAYADVYVTRNENETFFRNRAERVLRWPDFSVRQLLMFSIFGPQPMWRRAAHEAIGGFNPEYAIAGDYECFVRLAARFGAVHLNEVLGLYLEGGQESKNRETCRAETCRLLRHCRSTLPLETVYPFLQQPGATAGDRKAALLDFASLLRSGLYPDPELADQFEHQAADLPAHAAIARGAKPSLPAVRAGESVSQPRAFTKFPLSFCLITGGQRPELLSCVIASIRQQAIPEYEIIVVGRHHAEPGIIYVPAEQEAKECRRGALRNLGMARARYEHIVFLDDDCLLASGWFQALATASPQADLLTFQMRCVDGARYYDHATVGGPRGQQILESDETDEEFVYATAGAVLVRKSVLEAVPWDGQTVFGEDLTLSRECQSRGFKITHHHASCVYHADPTYTSVGRVVFRREQARPQSWVVRALAHRPPAQIQAAADFFQAQNRTAEAADCLRFGLLEHPADPQLCRQWTGLESSLGGKLSDGRWFPLGDPALLSLLKNCRPATASDSDDDLAQLGVVPPPGGSECPLPVGSSEIGWPLRFLGPFLAGTAEGREAVQLARALARRIPLGLFHQGPYSRAWPGELLPAQRDMLDALQAQFFALDGGVVLVQGPSLNQPLPADAEYRVGWIPRLPDGSEASLISACNRLHEVWVSSEAQREELARRGVEPDKLVVLCDQEGEAHDNPPALAARIVARLVTLARNRVVPSLPPANGRLTRLKTGRNGPAPQSLRVAWEGTFLDLGSLSHVNRELTKALESQHRLELTRVAPCQGSDEVPRSPATRNLAARLKLRAPGDVEIIVRHQWPPNLRRPFVGSWVLFQPWEYGALPADWLSALHHVSEIWVYSEYVRRVYVDSGIAPEKVKIVPLGIDPAQFHPEVPPLALPTQKRFKFLFVGGTIHRKGAELLLETYLQSFSARDDVCLVIKDFGGATFYAGQRLEDRIRAAQTQATSPEIVYLSEEMESVASLYTACDCLVHPYRGEGFGLPVLEAMACGLPVIVTGGGATDDFAADAYAYRLPAIRRPIGTQVGGLKLVHQGWLLEPDCTALAKQMTWVWQHPAEACTKGRLASQYVRREWTWHQAAQVAGQRLFELAERRREEAKALAERRARKGPALVLPAAARVGQLADARQWLHDLELPKAWDSTLAAIRVRPFHPEGYLLLAEIARVAGDSQTARRCAEYARQLAPGFKQARRFLKDLRGKTTKLPCPAPSPSGGARWRPESAAKSLVLPPPGGPSLSVCLIVRNEERFLERCLTSVRPVATQLVVVDTGSADRTVAIARSGGAEVSSFAWNDDFSAARNAALERATGDWILFLDADEELTPEGREKILEEIRDPVAMAYRLPIIDQGRELEGPSYVPRLFRNAPGLFYVGRVHEQVFSSLEVRRKEWGLENKIGTACLLHHGYVSDVVKTRNKIERNLRLLQQAVRELPNEPNLLMNLGLELVRSGQTEAGIDQYGEALQVLSALPADQIVPELRETLLTQLCTHLLAARRYDEILGVLQTPLARAGGLTASLHFTLGLVCLQLQQYREGAAQMRLCLAKRHQPTLAPVNPEIRKAAPHHCLAVCLAALGEDQAAAQTFRDALAEDSASHPLRFDYARFLAAQRQPVQALQLLHQLVTEKPGEPALWHLGGQIALAHPQLLSIAADWTAAATTRIPQNDLLKIQRAEALLLTGKCVESLSIWHQYQHALQPQHLAALVLCEAAVGAHPLAPEPTQEPAVSREFVSWYERLVRCGAHDLVARLTDGLASWRACLPTAAQTLNNKPVTIA